MITVIGMWEPDWMDTDRSEIRLWKQTIQAFNVDIWKMAPASHTRFSVPEQFNSIDEAIINTPGKKTFFVSPRTHQGVELKDYVHPENAIYVIGSAVETLMRFVTEDDDVVSVNTPTQAALFGAAFLSIPLYDRLIKQ